MAYDFAGKRVLVTGGSSGIGAALAERLRVARRHRRHLRTPLGGTERDARRSAERTAPSSAMWVCDMAVREEVDALADDVLAAFGGVDLLVNNAGIPRRKHVTRTRLRDGRERDAHQLPRRRSNSRWLCCPRCFERGEGRIVSVSSIAAPLSSPGESAYDASKAALAVFSEAMAMDLWFDGIKVMVVYPGRGRHAAVRHPRQRPAARRGMERIPVERDGRRHRRRPRDRRRRGLRPAVVQRHRHRQGAEPRRASSRRGRVAQVPAPMRSSAYARAPS